MPYFFYTHLRGKMKYSTDNGLKSLIESFNLETKTEFEHLYTERDDLLRQKKWVRINDIWALRGKYTPEQQVYALNKCKELGIRATSRILGVCRKTLQRWCKRFNVTTPRYPP